MTNDRTYFLKRAEQERSAAGRSAGRARQAHEEMAERYDLLAQAADAPVEPEPAPVQPAAAE